MALLHVCLEQFALFHKETTNAHSIAVAKLSNLVFCALGGKANKVKLSDFLPYELKDETNGLKDSTIDAMRWALKNEKMPPAIIGMVGAELG